MVDVNVLIKVTLLAETSLYERRMISLFTDVFSFFWFDEIGERARKKESYKLGFLSPQQPVLAVSFSYI